MSSIKVETLETPPEDLVPPKDTFGMVRLAYDPSVYLSLETLTRWYLNKEGELVRDLEGEKEWAKMAPYANKTYKDVFNDAYNFSKRK